MIQVDNLVKTYRTGQVLVKALGGVSFRVSEGEMLAIMGPSGSGKSTLMNILGCLDRPTSGTYLLDDSEIGKTDDDDLAQIRRERVGFVFQNFNLLPRITAQANVELPLLYSRSKDRKIRALESLERVGLGDRSGHRPTQLSGGEQQRVAIARALVHRPSIILADEPTGNLDSRVGSEIVTLFKDLNLHENITVILVTHDPLVAAQTQRVIKMRDGIIETDELAVQVSGVKV